MQALCPYSDEVFSLMALSQAPDISRNHVAANAEPQLLSAAV
jgi:hypothetical protein